MILYLDTSALVKLYAEEPGREEVENAVREARVVAVSEIGCVEARSALARKHSLRAYDAVHLATVLVLREESLELVEASQELGVSSPQEGTGLQVALMTFDRSLAKAARNEGLAYSQQISGEEQ